MKNKIKLLSALLIVIFSISLCTVPAFATDPPVDDDPVASEVPVVTEPPVTEPPATEPPVTEAPTTAPTTAKPTRPTKAPTTQPTTQEQEYTTKPQNTTSVQYFTNATQYQTYATYATEADTQSATITTEQKRIDEDTLDKSDWDEIRNELMSSNGSDNGAEDFNFIKNNTKREDDGTWLLVVGIILILVGCGLIGMYVVYIVRKKRYLEQRKNGRNGGSRGSGTSQRGRTPSRRPERDNFDDVGYYRSSRDYSSNEKRQINRRSKFDTGEVEIQRTRYSERSPRSSESRSGATRSAGRSGSNTRSGSATRTGNGNRGRSTRSESGSRYRH